MTVKTAQTETAQTETAQPLKIVKIRAAYCDYSARGSRRAHWYRMVWTPGVLKWRYFGDDRLRPVGRLANTRHQTVYGHVAVGSWIAAHDRGGKIDYIARVNEKGKLTEHNFRRYRGKLIIDVDGETIDLPDPRH